MARLDYYQIEQDIATQVRDDAAMSGVTVDVEQEPDFVEDKKVIIYCINREAPEELQSLSAGLRTRYYVTYVAVCIAAALRLKDAMEARDDLLSNVELALMKDRTFANAQVKTSWLNGGDFDNARDGDEGLFNAAAEIEIVVDATTIG